MSLPEQEAPPSSCVVTAQENRCAHQESFYQSTYFLVKGPHRGALTPCFGAQANSRIHTAHSWGGGIWGEGTEGLLPQMWQER